MYDEEEEYFYIPPSRERAKMLFSFDSLGESILSDEYFLLANKTEDYVSNLYEKKKRFVDFEEFSNIVNDSDFKTLGFEKLYQYFSKYNISFTKDELENLSKQKADDLLRVDSEQLFDLGVFYTFGFCVKRNIELGFFFLNSASFLEHLKAKKLVGFF